MLTLRRTWFPFLILVVTQAQLSAYDVREATVESLHNALFNGLTSCRSVVEAFLSRIEAYNPTINAIITLNPNALTTADAMDLAIAAGNVTGALFCIPILLKDNYDTVEMKTTGGCLDLADSQPTIDAPAVIAFKKSGRCFRSSFCQFFYCLRNFIITI